MGSAAHQHRNQTIHVQSEKILSRFESHPKSISLRAQNFTYHLPTIFGCGQKIRRIGFESDFRVRWCSAYVDTVGGSLPAALGSRCKGYLGIQARMIDRESCHVHDVALSRFETSRVQVVTAWSNSPAAHDADEQSLIQRQRANSPVLHLSPLPLLSLFHHLDISLSLASTIHFHGRQSSLPLCPAHPEISPYIRQLGFTSKTHVNLTHPSLEQFPFGPVPDSPVKSESQSHSNNGHTHCERSPP